MKRTIAVFIVLALLAGFAACGKEIVEPTIDDEIQTVTEAETETVSAPIETTTDETPTLANGETDMLSFTKYDEKTGIFTISGIEEFSMPWNYDVSQIKKIIISDNVLTADLDAQESTYARLETIQCAPECRVSVSTANITETPLYKNSANWTDGMLYIGSRLVAINKDAPAVCKLRSDLSSVGIQEDIAKTAPQIERFEIVKANKDYQTDKNGVLYSCSNDRLEIVLYPPASPVETYDLPDAVESLAFHAANNLKTIHISANSSLYKDYIDQVNVPAIAEYRVDAGHPYLFSKDGVLFKQADKNEWFAREGGAMLLAYPSRKTDKEYHIPKDTVYVEYDAFRFQSYLQTLYIPDSVRDFGSGVDGFWAPFEGCEKLTHVYVDGDKHDEYVYLTSTQDGLPVRHGADPHVIYLPGRIEKEYTIPDDVTHIEFYGNKHIQKITLGKNTDDIMVDECPNLNEYNAANNKNGYSTKDGVLISGSTLISYPQGKKGQKYEVPDGITRLYGAIEWSSDSAFHNNPYIEEIALPDSVTFIGIGAFADCTSLKKVNLPNALKYLGNGAFHGCTSLKEITIPTSLEALGFYDGISNYALNESYLTDIYYKGTNAQWKKLVNATGDPAILPSGVRVHCSDD